MQRRVLSRAFEVEAVKRGRDRGDVGIAESRGGGERAAPPLSDKVGDAGRTAADNRQVVNGCLWVLRAGAHWKDLPERYGRRCAVASRAGATRGCGIGSSLRRPMMAKPYRQHRRGGGHPFQPLAQNSNPSRQAAPPTAQPDRAPLGPCGSVEWRSVLVFGRAVDEGRHHRGVADTCLVADHLDAKVFDPRDSTRECCGLHAEVIGNQALLMR